MLNLQSERSSQDQNHNLKSNVHFYQNQVYYQALVEDCSDLIIRYLPNLVITFINPACVQFWEKNPKYLIGKKLQMIASPENWQKISQQIQTLTPEKAIVKSEEEWIRSDGSIRWLKWIHRGFFDEQGQLIEIQAVGQDITETRNLTELLGQIQAQNLPTQPVLKEAHSPITKTEEPNKPKFYFSSIVSHELRIPLTTIQMSADLLQLYPLNSEEKEECYQNLNLGIKNLTQLLDDIILLEKMNITKECYLPNSINLQDFCQQLIKEFRFIDKNKHILKFVCSQSPENTKIDFRLLRQVLNNLLANALKYSPEGSEVTLELLYQAKNVVFKIKDRGIGISPEDQKSLFEAFYRAKNVGAVPGSGLGLAIVKKCVELQGGKIILKSTVGVGTTAIVVIPLHG